MSTELKPYYIPFGKGLEIWERFIELKDFENHVIDYPVQHLLVTGHAFLVHGILTQRLMSNASKAREDFIKCIRRIRRVHQHTKLQNMVHKASNNHQKSNDGLDVDHEGKGFDDRRYEIKQFGVAHSFSVTQINATTLSSICSEWNWFHFDLNKSQWHQMPNYDATVFEAEIGPYDMWIIEAYSRLSKTFKPGSPTKINCLHKALKLLRNKDGFGEIVSIRILIDYAYTFLEQSNCNLLDKYYWFYLNILAFGLIHIAVQKIISDDELFDLQTRFLCGCIMNKLCNQLNYKRFMHKFVKENLSKSKTNPKNAIVRFLKIAYVAMNYGQIRGANDLYRSARGLVQYYINLEGKNGGAVYPKGKRLMDSFEIWWNFHYFCIYAIAAVTAHCVINFDSSYFLFLWDWVCWRCQCAKMMMECAKVSSSEYYGYCEEYETDEVNLAYFSAQAMILGVIHSSKKLGFYPNDKYLNTVGYLLNIAGQSRKFKEHCHILALFLHKQFGSDAGGFSA